MFDLHSRNAHAVEHSPPHHSSSVRTTPLTEVAYTPSTSPFLGPLRTLNIHSANPSRAPSPILLPPRHDPRDSIYADESMTPSRTGSIYGSPPSAGLNARLGKPPQTQPAARKGDTYFPMYGSSATSSQVPTPVLTSGPSSNGSSPGSLARLPSPTTLTGHYGPAIASGSRPPSPHHSRGSPLSTHASSRHPYPGGNQSTHHLAHSVRVAFGMTPVHSHPPSRRSSPPPPPPSIPRNTSWSTPSDSLHHLTSFSHRHPSSGYTTPFVFGSPHGAFGTGSTPGSRAPSPPIRLPALKNNVNMDSESTRRGNDKIELPHFSEFEASTRLPESVYSCSESKMSIDFVKS
jgi:zinc finger protein CreA/MIG